MFQIHAPAKVNLYLHVGSARADGRHPLDSLVVFSDARASDVISFKPGTAGLSCSIEGAGADEFSGDVDNNLVMRAARALEAAAGKRIFGHLTLTKRLPIAAGIGGGSSDAAATLLMLNAVCGTGLAVEDLIEIARPLGGDVPACVVGAPVLMRGDGDVVERYDGVLPSLPAMIVRPPVPCPTGAVFQAFDHIGGNPNFAEQAPPVPGDTVSLIRQLKAGYRNDLTRPATSMFPEILTVLEQLAGLSETAFVAMSGSGATCFALFPSEDELLRVSIQTKSIFPDCWQVCTRLGNAAFDPIGFSL